jgi:hypothetical protein
MAETPSNYFHPCILLLVWSPKTITGLSCHCCKETIDSIIDTVEIGSMVGMKGGCIWMGFLVLAVGYEVSAESSEVSSISFL